MRHSFFYTLILLITISCGEKYSETKFNELDVMLTTSIQNNEWDKLFNKIRELDIPNNFNDNQNKRLEEISKDIVFGYKNFKLNEIENKKDTIIYGFVLNSTKNDFRKRIKELRKENQGGFVYDTYNFRNRLLGTTFELKGYQQRFISEGVDCNLIISIGSLNEVNNLRVKHYDCNSSSGNFNDILIKNYGRFLDLTSYSDYKKYKLRNDWKSIYRSISNNSFNPFISYYISNEDLFRYKKLEYDLGDVIFNENFVIVDDFISYRFMTYKQFFKEYDEKLETLNNEKEKSKKVF